MRLTCHLVPREVWSRTPADRPYAPASLADEGFVHCTDGDEELLRTAERYYRPDPRPYAALTIDLDRVGAAWTVDDPGRIHPHVHGPIPPSAIVAVRDVLRAADGAFTGLGPARPAQRPRRSPGR